MNLPVNRDVDVITAGISTRALIEASEPLLHDLRMCLRKAERVLADLDGVIDDNDQTGGPGV